MTARSPADVITRALHDAHLDNPDAWTKTILHNLDGNGWEIRRKTKNTPIRRDCPEHPYTETPNGVCPNCGPTGN